MTGVLEREVHEHDKQNKPYDRRAHRPPSAKVNRARNAISSGPKCAKLVACHSPILAGLSCQAAGQGTATPRRHAGWRSAAPTARQPNKIHPRAAAARPPGGAASSASTAKGAISASPKAKPPCRFAHSANQRQQEERGRPICIASREEARSPRCKDRQGEMCGRARRLADRRFAPSNATTNNATPSRSRARRRTKISIAAAAAIAVRRRTPAPPGGPEGQREQRSDSHSCAVQDAPAMVKGKRIDARDCAMRENPIARL